MAIRNNLPTVGGSCLELERVVQADRVSSTRHAADGHPQPADRLQGGDPRRDRPVPAESGEISPCSTVSYKLLANKVCGLREWQIQWEPGSIRQRHFAGLLAASASASSQVISVSEEPALVPTTSSREAGQEIQRESWGTIIILQTAGLATAGHVVPQPGGRGGGGGHHHAGQAAEEWQEIRRPSDR